MGSNLGDRKKSLDAAVLYLRTLSPEVRVSSYYATAPVDCPPGSEEFLNAVAEIEFADGVSYLLQRFHEYEREQGRMDVRSHNEPRPIDLDILYAGELEMQTSRLILPHPRLAERLFVLEPLAEIAPERLIPGTGQTAGQLLASCRKKLSDQICRKIE